MTTQESTRNEAAERLLVLVRQRFDPITNEFRPLLDEALAAERRATVERIRARFADPNNQEWEPDIDEAYVVVSRADAILDEEAAR